MASAASMFGGFSRWQYALAEASPQHKRGLVAHRTVHPVYQPQFFSPEQYRTVEVLADLILPATHDARATGGGRSVQPGAKEAGVAEFIDFMVFSDPSLHAPFQSGLSWLDHASSPPASFTQLTAAGQTALLERLAYKAKHREDEKDGQQFFRLIRKYTVMGFYTTRVGLESLDYPGLTFYGTSPGCTHDGNPEHVGL